MSILQGRGVRPGPLFVASNGHRELIAEVPLQPNGLKQMLRSDREAGRNPQGACPRPPADL